MRNKSFNKSLKYLKSLIDKNGVLQFSKGSEKDFDNGYAVEDQARALILFILLDDKKYSKKLADLIISAKSENGIYNYWDKSRKIYKKQDILGEAAAQSFWSLCQYYKKYKDPKAKELAIYLSKELHHTKFPRSLAFTLLGYSILKDIKNTKTYADKLVSLYNTHSGKNWLWYENTLTYANALLPWALLEAYKICGNTTYLNIAKKNLDFLYTNLIIGKTPIVVGNKGWWKKGKKMAIYDQQPIDISYIVLASISIYEVSKNRYYLEQAKLFFSWFSGNNLKKKDMIRDDGGVYDGLNEYIKNKNSGAESVIMYLLAFWKLQNLTDCWNNDFHSNSSGS